MAILVLETIWYEMDLIYRQVLKKVQKHPDI